MAQKYLDMSGLTRYHEGLLDYMSEAVGTQSDMSITDPANMAYINNVPDWVRSENKPEYNAEEVGADVSGAAAEALASANSYTDQKIAALINDAPETLDTLKEVSDAIEAHQDVTDALNAAIGNKANASDLTSHTDNTTAHITSTERTNWNAAYTNNHTHSNKSVLDNTTASYTTAEKTKLGGIAAGAEVNQNAFSNVVVGSTTISADGKTDTLTLVAGSNVTLTPDATNDKVTIAATNTTYSAATQSANGLMSAADKKKLDGIATGAQVNTVTGIKGNAESSYRTGNVNLTPANIGAAAASHGNHVPTTQTASNKVFLRNDNTWQTVTPANIGAAASSHNQAASTITAGTLAGKVNANATAAATVTNAQVRDIYAGTTDMTAGTTALTTGTIYVFYE